MFNFNWQDVYTGIQVMLYGLGGVFTVLILFYLITRIMVSFANKFPTRKEDE